MIEKLLDELKGEIIKLSKENEELKKRLAFSEENANNLYNELIKADNKIVKLEAMLITLLDKKK